MRRGAAGIVAGSLLAIAAAWGALRFVFAEPATRLEQSASAAPPVARPDAAPPRVAEPVIVEEARAPVPAAIAPPTRASPAVARDRWSLRGQLVGIDRRAPWRTPVFLLAPARPAPSRVAIDDLPRRRDRSRPPRIRAGDRALRPGGELVERLDYDPVIAPPPSFADFPKEAQPLHATVAADGTFVIDLEELGRSPPKELPTALDVIANDPFYMPVRQSVPVAVDAGGAGTTIDVVIEVRLAGAVTGLVDAPGRGPPARRRGLGAVAGLFASEAGVPVGAPLDWCVAGDRYRLRTPRAGGHFVVVALDGHEPAFERVELALAVETEVQTFRLAPGSAISGRVLLPARSIAFDQNLGDELRVRAELDEALHALDLPEHPLAFSNGRLLNAAVSASADPRDDGLGFRLAGLREGRLYRVALAGGSDAAGTSQALSSRRVSAPAEDVELLLDAAFVGVDVSSAFRPLAGAEVSITGSPGPVATDSYGRAGFFVPPDRGFELEVTAKEHEPVRASLHSGPVGSLVRAHVAMEKVEPGATLALELACDGLASVHYARLRFEWADAAGVAFFRDARVEGGELAFKHLPSGKHRVEFDLLAGRSELKPDAAPPFVPGHWLVGAGFDVELRDHKVVRRERELRRGGKLRLVARNHDSASLPAACAIHDALGVAQETGFAMRTEAPRVEFVGAPGFARPWRVVEPPPDLRHPRELVLPGPSETARALEPGRYTVTFTHADHRPATVEAEVRAGEFTDVEVTLLPRS